MKSITRILSALICVAAIGARGAADTPAHLSQGWSDADRSWFYFTSQGSRLIPYRWFIALEQPGADELFRAPAYMEKFRFLQGGTVPGNPDDLPIGFAIDEEATVEEAFALKEGVLEFALNKEEYASTYVKAAGNYSDLPAASIDPPVRKQALRGKFPEETRWLGLTCAACHTARIEGRAGSFDIDGGPAQIDFTGFLQNLVRALEETTSDANAERFDRFADRVLGEGATTEDRDELLAALIKYQGVISGLEYRSRPIHPYGFARLDAFGILLNEIIGTAMDVPDNWRTADAPVSYPHLWGTPDLNWVQWNGSVHSPLARNTGEVLGVFADLRLTDPGKINTSANINALYELEERVKSLRPPAWPETHLGAIDPAAAAAGKQHYQRLCVQCHALPPYPTMAAADPSRQLVKVTMVPVQRVGTDPTMAMNFLTRTGKTGPLKPLLNNRDEAPAAELLTTAVGLVIKSEFFRLNTTPQQQFRMNDRREPLGPTPLQLGSYKARPLAGIWATAPYLHNGSVPNLYQMLLPPKDRSPTFQVGSRRFDSRTVGFEADHGGFFFDASLPGNLNIGHDYASDLDDDKRWELVEFLKTL